METIMNINGNAIPFDIEPVDGKGFAINIGGRTFETRIIKNNSNTVTVDVNGAEFRIGIDGDLKADALDILAGDEQVKIQTGFLNDLRTMTKTVKKAETLKKSNTDAHVCLDLDGAVVAPMPGKVVSIVASLDESIDADQVVCTIEAMKMQNEILAPLAGCLREICCSPGDLVEKGDVLFRIT